MPVRKMIVQFRPDNKGQWTFKNDSTIQRRFTDTADTIGDLRVNYNIRSFAQQEITIPGLL